METSEQKYSDSILANILLQTGFTAVGSVGVSQNPTDLQNGQKLREWWHSILRNYSKCSCYAFFLVLPGDKEAIQYLTDYGQELHTVSGEDCLVIALTDKKISNKGFDDEIWSESIKEHIGAGHSLKIAQHFNIHIDKLPCVIFFKDIRSPEHIIVTLKGMTSEEIGNKLRRIFYSIQQDKQNALSAIKAQQKRDALRDTGKSITQRVRSVSGKTFETAIQAFADAIVKSSFTP